MRIFYRHRDADGYHSSRIRWFYCVPEIDAFSGLAAMAVVGSIAALIWERRRKK